MVDLIERLHTLLERETSSYLTENYLDPEFQEKLVDGDASQHEARSAFFSSSLSSSSSSMVNEAWREKICQWSYQVVDHFELSREVVSISLSFLDRYLSKRQVNKTHFQLLAMTCLYLAIKMNERGTISMKSMIGLSRGYFTVKQMAEMEMDLLRTLSWQVHPPTSICFAKHILFLLPRTSVSIEARHEILELTTFLVELSAIDYFFVGRNASTIAMAALIHAMKIRPDVPLAALQDLYHQLDRLIPILHFWHPDVLECCDRLNILHKQSGHSVKDVPSQPFKDDREETISPISVTYGIYPKKGP